MRKRKSFGSVCGSSKKKGGRFTASKKEDREEVLHKNVSQSWTAGDESEGISLNWGMKMRKQPGAKLLNKVTFKRITFKISLNTNNTGGSVFRCKGSYHQLVVKLGHRAKHFYWKIQDRILTLNSSLLLPTDQKTLMWNPWSQCGCQVISADKETRSLLLPLRGQGEKKSILWYAWHSWVHSLPYMYVAVFYSIYSNTEHTTRRALLLSSCCQFCEWDEIKLEIAWCG